MAASLKIINTDKAPAALGPYSQGIRAGDLLFCSGQLALDPVTGVLENPEPAAQTARALSNLKAVLEAGGSSLDKVVRVGIFLKDMNHFAEVNKVYAEFFGTHKPARTTVEVSRLPKDALVEIEAVGVVS